MPYFSGKKLKLQSGKALPLGVTAFQEGHNFAIVSQGATALTLCIRALCIRDTDGGNDASKAEEKSEEIRFDLTAQNRTGDVWHILIEGLDTSFDYVYYAEGPNTKGHAFNPANPLIDPYAIALSGLEEWGKPIEPIWGHFCHEPFDWEEDRPLERQHQPAIIYEIHARGFTANPNSEVAHPGTYQGIIEKIPYLQSLGITAVELLPIHEFNEADNPFQHPETGKQLLNFWGYASINFFSIKASYAANQGQDKGRSEFKQMVKALHAAGIEVILDVVFNHSAEGGGQGRTYNFKGLDNKTYYMLDEEGEYQNFSGCGNSMNCNHPVLRKMILESLCYFVIEFHIDGFRFDLASILSRDSKGNVLPSPPLIEAIAKHPVLSNTRIIAEAWDAMGLYQVGRFHVGESRWAEWNGMFRDVIRRFSSGEAGITDELATRLAGSADLYETSNRAPHHSINFITSHDGFTLWDLVSYQSKHNWQNAEENRDGSNDNYSQNCGVEGPSKDPEILSQRIKQVYNLAVLLLLGQGTPMMLGGDELTNSQMGNNNAWCQDNPLGWIDWSGLETRPEVFSFFQALIQFRKENQILSHPEFFTGHVDPETGSCDLSWHNYRFGHPEFESSSKSLSFWYDTRHYDPKPGLELKDAEMAGKQKSLFVILNFWDGYREFALPREAEVKWEKVLDTAQPEAFLLKSKAPQEGCTVMVQPFSIQVFTCVES